MTRGAGQLSSLVVLSVLALASFTTVVAKLQPTTDETATTGITALGTSQQSSTAAGSAAFPTVMGARKPRAGVRYVIGLDPTVSSDGDKHVKKIIKNNRGRVKHDVSIGADAFVAVEGDSPEHMSTILSSIQSSRLQGE